jgi:hypothetical protein
MRKTKLLFVMISVLLLLLLWSEIIFATATIARARRSPYLPWQGVPLWNQNPTNPTGFDPAHNVGGNNPSGEYLPDKRFSVYTGAVLTKNWVIFDSITGLYWESTANHETCRTFDTSEIRSRINTNCISNNTTCSSCAAQEYCDTLKKWWFEDWRIPSPTEFQTLNVLYNSTAPYIDETFFLKLAVDDRKSSCTIWSDLWLSWTNAADVSSITDNWLESKYWAYNLGTLSFVVRPVNFFSAVNCNNDFVSVRCVRGPVRY